MEEDQFGDAIQAWYDTPDENKHTIGPKQDGRPIGVVAQTNDGRWILKREPAVFEEIPADRLREMYFWTYAIWRKHFGLSFNDYFS